MTIPPTRTLIFVNMVAMAGLAYLWVDPQGQPRPLAWVAPAPIKPVVAAVSLPEPSTSNSDATALSATLERPIFAPDRRPPPLALPPPPPDAMANVHLLGLFSGDVSGALIRSEGKVRRITLKQKLGEWTLQAIEDRSITFERDNETRVIRLEYTRMGVPVQPMANQAPPITGKAGPPQQAINDSRRAEDLEKERIRAEISARMTQKKP